jgi:hypothetical protein
MANYIINECLTNDEYIVSAVTPLTVGEVIKFYIGEENPFCGTVGEVTSSPVTPLSFYDSVYTDCCECLSGFTDSLNFKFIRCGTSSEEISIEATDFCSEYGVPTTGITYEIQNGLFGTPFCATFSELSPTGETNYHFYDGPFLDCENCISPPPISAGTETIVCVIDCSGNTTTITPPHPTWTDGYGRAIVLLDAIELGGMNGLNS